METSDRPHPLAGKIAAIGILAGILLGTWFLLHIIHVSSTELLGDLDDTEPDTVRESLIVLQNRRDPAGIEKAINLEARPDDTVWLQATLYLGSFGKPEAVPYLIKALRHSPPNSAAELVADLKSITGQSFGNDFAAWHAWWMTEHSGSDFDFDSNLGPDPQQMPVTTRATNPTTR